MFCEIGAHTHTHTPMHTHLLFAGLNTSFLLSFQNFPSSPYPPWQHKVGLRFWLTTTTDTSPPLLPLHPHFNPLPIPLSLPLLFLFCSEWRSKAAVSASFPSLIALLAGGGTRSFSDTDGEGGGSSKGEKKNGWLVFVVVAFPSHLFSGLFAWTLTPRADTDTLLTLMPVKATYGGWQGKTRI